MKVQIASDIHIEKIYPKSPEITDYIIPSSETLILAGDIGSIYHYEVLKNFFISCKKRTFVKKTFLNFRKLKR